MAEITTETVDDVVTGIIEHNGSLETLLQQARNAVQKHQIDSDTLELDRLIQSAKLNPTVLYCKQTGAPIGTIDPDMVKDALALHPNMVGLMDQFPELCSIDISKLVHPNYRWLVVSPEQMDKLRFIDPYGFYMYCVNRMARVHNPHWHRFKSKWGDQEEQTKHNRALLQAWQVLQNCDIADIHIANDRWAKLFAHYKPQPEIGLYSNPLEYATPGFVKRVGLIVHNILSEIFEQYEARNVSGNKNKKNAVKEANKDGVFSKMQTTQPRKRDTSAVAAIGIAVGLERAKAKERYRFRKMSQDERMAVRRAADTLNKQDMRKAKLVDVPKNVETSNPVAFLSSIPLPTKP